jgi:hypothetical protein
MFVTSTNLPLVGSRRMLDAYTVPERAAATILIPGGATSLKELKLELPEGLVLKTVTVATFGSLVSTQSGKFFSW